ncbi:MAG: DUF2723 domain-containing protein [Marinoscillum sp.]
MKISALLKEHSLVVLSVLFQLAALLMMALDPEPHGFGILTLWIAPILLIIGLILPAVALARFAALKDWKKKLSTSPYKSLGFLMVFGISFITYFLTLEPTASLWDCSETIAAAYKLQVPHTPGTPLTLLIGRLFSMLAFDDVTRVAWCVNLMAGFFSALAVGFAYLITWHFGKRIIPSRWPLIFGSIGGALCLTFSDSFWFSAVEAETYGPSVFFMVFLIWLTIKGAEHEGAARKRHVYLLSYLVGLSYCIHPMCILILPVCFLIWRFRAPNQSWKQMGISFLMGVVSILFISKVIAVDLYEWAFQLDLLLVNQLSMPFYSGVFLLLVLLVTVSILLWKKFTKSRAIVVCIWLVIAGFTPYLMLFIRSGQMPPINEFTPNNLAKIKPYMNRESYPGRPLVFGPYYDAKITEVNHKAKSYVKEEDGYKMVGEVPEYVYEQGRKTLLPRIYSNDPNHMATYQRWTGLSKGEKPRFSDNLKFMMHYQIGHMYGRYLMWNFAGRISDVQHAGWQAPWHGLPDRSAMSYNRASNQYFMIPFLLGLLGMFFQLRRDRNDFITNLSFFLITGLLLTLYLNGTPNEPRERDYIYVGSYVAFSIWIGLGMMAIMHRLSTKAVPYLGAFLLIIPVWMAYQNLDDHNRSGRTFQTAYTRTVLGSCDPGAILFTGGDNDTFPLWYIQDVEGFRTDVRVKVLSYFNADWYIDQLSRTYYDSPDFNLTLRTGDNQYGPYDPVYVQERMQAPIDWGKYMEAIRQKSPQLRIQGANSELYFIPSRKINIRTSKGSLQVNLNGSYLPKSEMAILDLIYSNDWERPIYFNFTSLNTLNIDLKPYVVQEGLVYRLKPERYIGDELPMDLEQSYEHLVVNADYSNLGNERVYFNYEDYQARMINPLRFAFNQLINSYAESGNQKKVLELSQFAYENFYFDHLEPSYADVQLSAFLNATDQKEKARNLIHRLNAYFVDKIGRQLKMGEEPERNDVLVLQESVRILKDPEVKQRYDALLASMK